MFQIFPSLLTCFIFLFILEGSQMLTYRLQNGKQLSAEGWHLPWAVKRKYFGAREWGKVKIWIKYWQILSVFLIFLLRESIQAATWSRLHKMDALISGWLFSIHHISNIVKKRLMTAFEHFSAFSTLAVTKWQLLALFTESTAEIFFW